MLLMNRARVDATWPRGHAHDTRLELRELGLLDADGRRTPAGERVYAELRAELRPDARPRRVRGSKLSRAVQRTAVRSRGR
ncbi:MAG TPA: hypothetical protein VFG69_15285 [Nannocystaceae bacterium]|nr:hypothetical protein [Nannocystaceae bacterium]